MKQRGKYKLDKGDKLIIVANSPAERDEACNALNDLLRENGIDAAMLIQARTLARQHKSVIDSTMQQWRAGKSGKEIVAGLLKNTMLEKFKF